MPYISGSVPVTGFVAPTDSADTYPSHDETYGKGGYRTVADITARNNIPSGRRKEGMKVYVLSNGVEYTLGSGLLDADWSVSKNSALSLDTVADLAALSGTGLPNKAWFHVSGRLAAFDGGGGWFWYDSSSSVTADGSMVVAPASGPGRIFREWDGTPINILWFGANPAKNVSGTLTAPSTDNAVPINAAINFAAAPTYGPTDVRCSVQIPAGDFWISTSIVMKPLVNLIGEGTTFSDSDVSAHTPPSGMISGATRLLLKTGSNVPMLTFDLSTASARSSFAYSDDNYQDVCTITVATPAVITVTGHGLTAGRTIGFFTTGALPTGLAQNTLYYVSATGLTSDTFQVSATLGGTSIATSGTQSGIQSIVRGVDMRMAAGCNIRGISFYGNGINQTRNDCHGIVLRNGWDVNIDNCHISHMRGYWIWMRECNTVNIRNCSGNGGDLNLPWYNKGVFLYSCGDLTFVGNMFGGFTGPALWVCGINAWQALYHHNMLYSNYSKRYQVSSIVGDEITFTEDHAYENGSPIEFVVDSGSTLPTACTDTINMWAIKTGARTIKVTLQYDDAVSGTKARSLSSGAGGSGTLYVWHGSGSGAYLSSGAHDNTFVGNRCEQNSSHGIHLNNAYGNVFTGNLCNVNQFDPYNNVPLATPYAAGIYLRNGSKENGIFGNAMSDWTPTYPQKYGVWIDDNCGRNYLGQNAYYHHSSLTDTLVSTVGNTTQTAVVNEYDGATLTSGATASPLKLLRTDTGKQWEFQLSTDVIRLINSTAAVTGIDLNSTSVQTTMTVGRNGWAGPMRHSIIQGDQANVTAAADSSGADFYLIPSNGSGNSVVGGTIRFFTPNAGASGTTPQTPTEKVNIPRDGGLVIRTKTSAPVNGLSDGLIYPHSTDSFFYGRLGSAWHTMSNPNKVGISTVPDDANATLTFSPLVSKWHQVLNVPITGNRTVTLSTSFAQSGTEATFTRSSTSTGAFNWSIAGLINLTAGTWCKVSYDGSTSTVTMTSANPGVFTKTAHGFYAGSNVKFATGGALPTNIVAGTTYYVIATGLTANDFQVSATIGGTAIDTTAGTPSGTHTVAATWVLAASGTDPATLATSTAFVDAASDTTTWIALATSQTGNVAPATDAGLTFNASNNYITCAGGFLGSGDISMGNVSQFYWSGRALMKSPSDGVLTIYNNAGTDFTRLQLGGTTTSFPALGRSTTTIAVQLADGTAGGKLSVGATQSKVGGTIDQKYTSTGTPASSTETDLHTFTTVANTLGADGDSLSLVSGGTFSGNASATSQLRVYFGGTQIFASGALTAAAAGSWHIEAFLIRSSSTTVRSIVKFTSANAITAPLVTETDLTGLTLSGTNILKVTGQGGGASPAANDIVYKLGVISFAPVF
jgi:parallel beta-helix repeat protein